MYRTLEIRVEPPGSSYPQARIWIDGADWLGPEVSGLDPQELEHELIHQGAGNLLLGRLEYYFDNDELRYEVLRNERAVVWTDHERVLIRFAPRQYDAELARFAADKSWETVERTAERIVTPVFHGTTIKRGFGFEWASARGRVGVVRLAYRKGGKQKFLKFEWDGKDPEDALKRAIEFRAKRLAHA